MLCGEAEAKVVPLRVSQSAHVARSRGDTRELKKTQRETIDSCEKADHKLFFRQSAGNPSAFFMRSFFCW